MDIATIISLLPYTKPFLFVDTIDTIDQDGVVGKYTFRPNEFYYEGHFKNHPVTPGVILTECMAQIGLVCLGIYLSDSKEQHMNGVALSNSKVDFLLPVYPGETVKVVSEKVYFRFGKLKCKVKMLNADEALVCQGVLSGMIVQNK